MVKEEWEWEEVTTGSTAPCPTMATQRPLLWVEMLASRSEPGTRAGALMAEEQVEVEEALEASLQSQTLRLAPST